MKPLKTLIRSSAVATALLTMGTALAFDVAVQNSDVETRAPSMAEILALKPVVNPLLAPNVSGAILDTTAGPNAKGVMTKDGPQPPSRGFGTFGIPYTATRVQAGTQTAAGATAANHLSTTFPYRTIGKLTFTEGYCSASLIRRSVIVTAAHCIQDFGSGGDLFTNFHFIPGHYGAAGATAAQVAPYGTFRRLALVRPKSWANGTDIGSGAARDNDLAVMALAKNSQGQFAGDLVGAMSYGWNNYSFVSSQRTGNLNTAAVTTLGYPFLLDGGAIMQRTDGPSYTTMVAGSRQLQQGSNFTGGSSGGPWVVNFSGRNPALAGGAVKGREARIAVIGVTSWGSEDPNAPKDNFSSQFSQNSRYPDADYGGRGAGNIGSLLNTLCSKAAPGGGTYASRGFCD